MSDKVRKKICQVFPQKKVEEILARLDEYGTAPYEKCKERVHLAILKLCDEEQLDDPVRYITAAKGDYRDVLAWAEAPNQMRFGPTRDSEKAAALRKKDQEQYQAWLEKA